MLRTTEPTRDEVNALLRVQCEQPFRYPGVGTSSDSAPPPGFDLDHNRVRIGQGAADFEAAVVALRAWAMFPAPWTRIAPAHAPIAQGTVVAMSAHAVGFWWLNACRIVYLVDDSAPVRRFGFAYGTLPTHVESGEERFTVELHANGEVWYDLRAFSRPRYWLARDFKPVARRLQRRFVRESQQAMRRAVELAQNP
jgi:uncharacterized protein (UPF0548 family)